MAKVTIKEIAELANVSPAAVSMAIRGRKGISEETRANILHIAQSMGYRSPQRSRTGSEGVRSNITVSPGRIASMRDRGRSCS